MDPGLRRDDKTGFLANPERLPSMSPSWLPSAIIYQIFTGRWEADVSNGQIKSRDTFLLLKQRNWQRLLDLCINTLYFLGIWDHRGPIIVQSEEGRDLTHIQPGPPSVFAITDHTRPHPELGSPGDFRALVTHLHHIGFKVIVDFIPNHTGTVHPWINQPPEC